MKTGKIFWIAVPVVLIAACYVAYRMFEPVLVYNSGWQDPPARAMAPDRFELADQGQGAAAEAAKRALTDAFRSGDFPALSVAIGGRDGLLWRGAIGYADIGEGKAVTFDGAFRIGSSSKAVTAAMVGVLMDRGVLQLDQSMRGLDPSLPDQFGAMTLGHVMSHRGGVRNYRMCLCFPAWEFLNQRKFSSVREAVAVIENDPLLFEPGTGFSYTSLGYNLAGLAIVQATGTPYPRALEEVLTGPLGMTGTRAEGAPGSAAPEVRFYDVEPKGYKETYPVDNSIKWPSGGLLSTPTDMTRLGAAMMDEGFLTEATRTALLTVPEAENGSAYYAHGWRVSSWELPGGATPWAWHHHGTAAGSRSVFVILPQEGLVLSIMTNKAGTSVDELYPLAGELLQAFVEAGQG